MPYCSRCVCIHGQVIIQISFELDFDNMSQLNIAYLIACIIKFTQNTCDAYSDEICCHSLASFWECVVFFRWFLIGAH